jgi:hypothetical protein
LSFVHLTLFVSFLIDDWFSLLLFFGFQIKGRKICATKNIFNPM